MATVTVHSAPYAPPAMNAYRCYTNRLPGARWLRGEQANKLRKLRRERPEMARFYFRQLREVDRIADRMAAELFGLT